MWRCVGELRRREKERGGEVEDEKRREEEDEKRREEEEEVWGGELCDVIWRYGGGGDGIHSPQSFSVIFSKLRSLRILQVRVHTMVTV